MPILTRAEIIAGAKRRREEQNGQFCEGEKRFKHKRQEFTRTKDTVAAQLPNALSLTTARRYKSVVELVRKEGVKRHLFKRHFEEDERGEWVRRENEETVKSVDSRTSYNYRLLTGEEIKELDAGVDEREIDAQIEREIEEAAARKGV